MRCWPLCTPPVQKHFILVKCLATFCVAPCLFLAAKLAVAAEPELPRKRPAHLDYQYKFDEITILPARADEPKLTKVSIEAAKKYIEDGSTAWSGERNCVSCHTNGMYLKMRPSLTAQLGAPSTEERAFAVQYLSELAARPRKSILRGTLPAAVIYIAAGLAEWDTHITHQLSPDTERALQVMFDIQLKSGTWGAADCWPPFESSAFQEATVAAMAVGTAPGWLASLQDQKLKDGVEKLKQYLRTVEPQEDYDRCLLLWAEARLPGILTAERKKILMDLVLDKQRPDGGWSIRTFGQPEEWGKGNRAKKLRGEPEFADPPSDGHQTGLAIILLRESGMSASDPRIARGVAWLKANQRESGRWWTRSLNTDSWHFVTYSGTLYPLRALALCDALPATEKPLGKVVGAATNSRP